MDLNLKKPLQEMNAEEKRALAETLQYCADQIQKTDSLKEEITQLKETNRALNIRLENAKEYFKETKETLETAESRTKTMLARNIQKTRDEIYSLGNALHEYATALAQKPTSKMTLVQVNNLQAALETIIKNLEENGLWNPEMDVKPNLTLIEKQETAKKPRKPRTKKVEITQEQEELQRLIDDMNHKELTQQTKTNDQLEA